MNTMNIEVMAVIEGGSPGWVSGAGWLLSRAASLLLDDDFTQGIADGWVGAPQNMPPIRHY